MYSATYAPMWQRHVSSSWYKHSSRFRHSCVCVSFIFGSNVAIGSVHSLQMYIYVNSRQLLACDIPYCYSTSNGRNIFFSLKKDGRTRGQEIALVKDQCRLDIRKYSFSQRAVNEWNKLYTDCVNASSMNMFKSKVDTYQEGGLRTDDTFLDS